MKVAASHGRRVAAKVVSDAPAAAKRKIYSGLAHRTSPVERPGNRPVIPKLASGVRVFCRRQAPGKAPVK